MTGYMIRRLLLIPPTLLVVMLMVFAMVSFLPGDAVDAAGGRGASGQSKEAREAKRVQLGLDRPRPVQLIAYLIGWPTRQGSLVSTTDGGLTWFPVVEGRIYLFNALFFFNGSDGWAADRSGKIYVTENGGVGWLAKLTDNESQLHDVTAAGEQSGWAVGDDGVVFATADGGETWAAQASGVSATLRAVAFFDERTGLSVGDGGTVIRTQDGGAMWSVVTSGVGANLTSVAFGDAQHAWAVGDAGTIIRTTDGGATWSAQPSGTSAALTAVDFFDAERGWAVGAAGTILATVDGGATWRVQNSGVTTHLASVSVVGEALAVVAGRGGLVLKTTDGLTWERQAVNPDRPITDDMHSVAMANEYVGFAAGWQSNWDWGLVGGDLGTSLLTGRTAAHELSNRIPRSLQLMVMAMIIAVGVGVPFGVFAAIRQDGWIDYAVRSVAVIGLSLPGFWLATLIILLPAVWWQWTPPLEWVSPTQDPVRNLQFFLLPSLVVGFGTMAAIMRMTRAQMLEVMRQDYIRTAWSKGLRESAVVVRHALKNALIPVVTIVGIQIPFILGETVVIEFIFRVPGIGLLGYESVTRRDYPMLQAVVLFLASMYISMNLVVDLVYGWLDPRIRYG